MQGRDRPTTRRDARSSFERRRRLGARRWRVLRAALTTLVAAGAIVLGVQVGVNAPDVSPVQPVVPAQAAGGATTAGGTTDAAGTDDGAVRDGGATRFDHDGRGNGFDGRGGAGRR